MKSASEPWVWIYTHVLILVLRALAEAKVSWALWPPGTSLDTVAEENFETDAGAWLSGKYREDQESDQESDEDEAREAGGSESSEMSSETDESEGKAVTTSLGRFGALQISDVENENEDAEGEEE
jgi:hypothetical protein